MFTNHESGPRWSRLSCLLLVLFLVPLIVHIYLGSYSRFIADDFCSAATARSKGIIGGALHWYLNWTGRFSANLLDSFFGYLGPAVTPYTTALVLITWFGLLAYALHLAFRIFQQRTTWCVSLSGAAIILFALLDITPSVGQSVYWGQGMRSVVPPLILATGYVALIERSYLESSSGGRTILRFLLAGLLPFLAGGFSETYVAVQTSALALAVVFSLVSKQHRPKKQLSWLLATGFIGSLAALAMVVYAPGNQFRRTPFPPPPGLLVLFQISWEGMVEFFKQTLWSPPHQIGLMGLSLFWLLVGVGFFNREPSNKIRRSNLAWTPISGFLLLFVCHVPIAYSASLNLPDRTLIIPTYVMVVVLSLWSYLFGQRLANRLTKSPTRILGAVFVFLFSAWGIYSGLEMLKQRTTFQSYAGDWSARELLIQSAKSQGSAYVIVPQIHNWAALDEIEPDPKISWLTKCVGDYYGISVLPEYDGPADPNALQKQRELEVEFQAIKPPSEAEPAPLNSFYKTPRGKVGFYNTEQNYEAIKSYYNSELTSQGWKFIGERRVEVFQTYTGGMHALFCKGSTSANLFYTGHDRERLGYSYSVALNWNTSSGYVWGVADCE